jgi:lantibiotic modifying enzyme
LGGVCRVFALSKQEEIKRYYQRAGQLLCLLYVLGANDCHNENLIACGEHPVLVDLETLMHHPFREIAGQERKEGAEALSLAHQQLDGFCDADWSIATLGCGVR